MQAFTDGMLFVSLGSLGGGFLIKKRWGHALRALGWSLFGIFWFLQTGGFLESGDAFNALASASALPIFMFIAFHELLSYEWNEEYEPLRFLTGATFIAGIIYFLVDRIPLISGLLIKIVADHTVAFLNGLNFNYYSGGIDYAGNGPWYRTNGNEIFVPITDAGINQVVQIVLACTALQAMAVAMSFISSTKDPMKRKVAAFAIVMPAIYIMNLVRNVVIVYYFDVERVNFELVHGYIGKALSLAVLVLLVLLTFYLLPQLYENINGLFELPWRKGPNHDYRKRLARPSFKMSKRYKGKSLLTKLLGRIRG